MRLSHPSNIPSARSSGPLRRLGPALALLVLAVIAGAVAKPGPAVGAPGDPNVIVLMTDDQAFGELAVMRKTRGLLANRGVSFENYIASYPLCCPSRVTFLTGQYSHNHGVLGNGTPIGGFSSFRQRDNLGSWLQEAGYHTTHIGKFLNGYGKRSPIYIPPGWDDWQASIDPSTNEYYDYRLNQNGKIVRYGRAPDDYKTDVYADKAVTAIRQQEALGAGADPFFMFVGFTTPHLPAVPAPRHVGDFNRRALPLARSYNEEDVSDKPSFIRKIPRFNAARKKKILRNYRRRAESLLSVDDAVAAIISELDSQDLLEDTYVMFVSDNGFFFGQHRIGKGKYLPYEGASRVPLIIRGPGLSQGATVEAPMGNVDLAPTILDITGASPTVTVDGQSLLPFTRQPSRRSSRPILLEANTRDRPSPGIPYTGIRTDRYKYVVYRNGQRELYDLMRDPGELRSRHRDPRYAKTRNRLARELAQLRDCAGLSCQREIGQVPGPN